MRSAEIKKQLERLAKADPDGIGLLKEQLGEDEWDCIASHAAGFLSAWMIDKLNERYTVSECESAALMAHERNETVAAMLKEVRARREKADLIVRD